MFTHVLLFLGACILLVISAEYLVKSLTKIGYYLKLTEFVMGFMVVALATSLPELFVGITSALEGTPELSLGNVIGANIVVLTLVVGILTLIKKGINIETKTVRTDTRYMFFVTLIPLILMLDRQISRIDGVILLIVFFLYVSRLFSQERRFRETIDSIPRREFVRSVVVCFFSLALLILSAELVVKSATSLAIDLNVPTILIGLFMLSLGTTLPELIFETKAMMSQHRYMALGDLIGSVVANSTLVLGVAAVIHPITPNFLLFLISALFMIFVAFLFMIFVESENKIHVNEGITLIFLYILFLLVMFNLQMIEFPGVS